VDGVAEAYCCLLSQIGRPIDAPRLIDLRLRLEDPAALAALQASVAGLARAHPGQASTLWREVIAEAVPLW